MRWPDAIVIAGSGPSLTEDAANWIRHVPVLAVNDAYRRVQHAFAIYAADFNWWQFHCQHHDRYGKPGILTICPRALRFSAEPAARERFGCEIVTLDSGRGISPDRNAVRRGYGSGFQAVGLAINMGVRRIALIGMDCKRGDDGRSHFFGDHPQELPVPQPFELWADDFNSLAEPARMLGIRIADASNGAITAIEKINPQDIEGWLYEEESMGQSA
jgi:hypothetical protein